MKNRQTIIIGAGASGLCAGITLARAGQNVTILEQSSKAGKKVLASGNGKCNISNRNISIHRYHGENTDFIHKVLEGYNADVVEKFFSSIGLELVEGKDGKLFPMSMQASSVVALMLQELARLGVDILCDCTVTSVSKDGNGFTIETSQGRKKSTTLVLASGSMAAPRLGGNDSGYSIATSLGHTIVSSSASLVQLCSDDEWVAKCSGVKITAAVKLYANGEYITEKKGDILFANYGISGLAILDISRYASIRLSEYAYCELSLDLIPALNKERLSNLLLKRVDGERNIPIELWLQGIINKKLIPIILEQSRCKIDTESKLNRKEIGRLVYAIKNLKISISSTRGYQGAEVATGGISTKEINPETMESRIMPGLYTIGEILDVDGDRGGFNLHFAWVCGMRLGKYFSK